MARNQKELAAALGMSEGQVSKLKRRGMPTDSIEAARTWRSRNVGGYVRTDAAAAPAAATAPADPAAPGAAQPAGPPLDLGQERAALARAQRLSVEMRNAVQAGEYAPIKLLAQVLASASRAVAERFDHLPGDLRKKCPEMTEAQRDQVAAVIAAARCEWIAATAQLVADELGVVDDEPDAADAEVITPDPETAA
jgi:phage terminase Nu1 subunit (DNA packaging protein)